MYQVFDHQRVWLIFPLLGEPSAKVYSMVVEVSEKYIPGESQEPEYQIAITWRSSFSRKRDDVIDTQGAHLNLAPTTVLCFYIPSQVRRTNNLKAQDVMHDARATVVQFCVVPTHALGSNITFLMDPDLSKTIISDTRCTRKLRLS